MQIHWRNAQEIDEQSRDAAVAQLEALAAHHRDLIDLWIDVEPQSAHHRSGPRSVELRCQARGAELVVHGKADELGLALRDALRRFERSVQRLRGERRDSRGEPPSA
jgi:ribosome-associated translation inhibitor RaiA